MPLRRKPGSRPSGIPGLTNAQIDVLLTGDSEEDPFLRFEWWSFSAKHQAALWQQHGEALKAEAARRGITIRKRLPVTADE